MDLVTHFLMFQTGIQLLEQLKIMKIVFKIEGPTLIGVLNSLLSSPSPKPPDPTLTKSK